MSWTQVLRWRFERHLLVTRCRAGVIDVARRVCGLHAQLMGSAVAAAAVRSTKGTAAAVERALWRDRTLVKTWAARGTLHLLPSADLPTWVAMMATRRRHEKAAWLRYHDVNAKDVEAVLAAMPEALAAGQPLTREELAAEVARISGRTHLDAQLRSGWGALLKIAAFQGLLCSGPPQGRSVTFVAPAAWLKDWPPAGHVDLDRAIDELARAHLGAYGPSTHAELARWIDVELRIAKASYGRLAARGDIVPVDLDGTRAFALADDAKAIMAAAPVGAARLLPAFDPYVVGSLRQLEHLLPAGVPKSVVSKTAGWIAPVIAVDGRIVGTWSATKEGVDLEPFGRLPAAVRRELEAQAPRVSS